MAGMLIALSLACIVLVARIIMDYLDRRDEARASIDRLETEWVDLEYRQNLEVERRDLILERLPGIQAALDGLCQRLHELRPTLASEQDRKRRLEIAAYKMQIRMARSR